MGPESYIGSVRNKTPKGEFMKPNNKKQSVLWTSLAVFAVACSSGGALTGKLDGGETATQLGLKVQASSAAVTAIVEATNLTVESGEACVEEIRLKLPEGLTCADAGFVAQAGITCEEEQEEEDEGVVTKSKIKIAGPFLFDLVKGTSTPSLADLAIPSGAYRETEFRFGPVCNMGGETTITLNGTMLDSLAVAHPFALNLEYEEELEIDSPTDVQVLEDQANGLFASIVLDNWFAAVDFVGCIDDGDLVETNGVIEINKDADINGNCENIYEDLVESIKDSMEFEDPDHDDDGVDDNEDNHDNDPNHE